MKALKLQRVLGDVRELRVESADRLTVKALKPEVNEFKDYDFVAWSADCLTVKALKQHEPSAFEAHADVRVRRPFDRQGIETTTGIGENDSFKKMKSADRLTVKALKRE